MSEHEREPLDDMMDSLDEFWLYEQMTKDDDDDVNLDFDDDYELDDADFAALEKNYNPDDFIDHNEAEQYYEDEW